MEKEVNMQNLMIILCILSFPWNKKEEKKENFIMRLWVLCEDYKDGILKIKDYGEFKLKEPIDLTIKDNPDFLVDTLGEPIPFSNVQFPCYLELELEIPYPIEEVSDILDNVINVLSIKYVGEVDIIEIEKGGKY